MIAGLDIGTTNTKFSIYSAEGTVMAQASEGYGQNYVKDRISAQSIWEAVQIVIQRACRNLTSNVSIEAMAISAFGECVVPVDQNGNALCDSFLGSAVEGEDELLELLGKIPEEDIKEITGLLPHKRFSLVKICWYRKHTHLYEQAYKFVTMEDFILCQLTGRFVTSESSAGRTMAYDWKQSRWSSRLLEAAQIDITKLPEILPSGSFAGMIRKEVLGFLNLPNKIRVFTGGHDQMCNAVGAGICDYDTALNCSGTVECVAGVIERPLIESAGQVLPLQRSWYPLLPDSCLTFWAPVAGCSALDWCLRFTQGDIASQSDHLVELHQKIQKQCSPTPTHLLTAPYFTGRNYPDLWNGAGGEIYGINLYTEPYELYQSIMESITFEIKICLEKWRVQQMHYKRLVVTGGGSHSDYWMQLKANITGLPIVRLKHTQSGTMGAMLFAAVGMGCYMSIPEACAACIRSEQVFTPQKSYQPLFEEKYSCYQQFRKAVCLQKNE